MGSNDAAIWAEATRRKAIIISKDEDFAIRSNMSTDGPGVLWIRLGNCRNQNLKAWLEKDILAICQSFEKGESLIEII